MAPSMVDKDRKKAQIAEAALHVFARKGTSKTKMADVAKEAGIGKGTVYEYFPSKDALFYYTTHLFIEQIYKELGRQILMLTDPLDKLTAIIRTSLNMFIAVGEKARFMLEIWAEGIRSGTEFLDLAEMYTQYHRMLSAVLEDGIRQGVYRPHDVSLTASFIIGALDGLFLQMILGIQTFSTQQASDEIVEMVLNGIGNVTKDS